MQLPEKYSQNLVGGFIEENLAITMKKRCDFQFPFAEFKNGRVLLVGHTPPFEHLPC